MIELLTIAGDEIGAELQRGANMRQAAILLSATPRIDQLSDEAHAALAALLPQIFALYTMAQERDVHTANVPHAFAVTTAVVETDDDDDGLF